MDSSELRDRFVRFFAGHGHTVVASASLVPDDPTLLFTNAGMVQFKDTFLGLQERAYRRATTVQKCLRVSGKHNDLENVGPSPRHHTFFEMLGNFSFGDYFKREAIDYAWSFLTREVGIPADRLVVTTHHEDDEAYRHWRHGMGLPEERVLRMGDKTNFWMMADVGPCGPTTELHYDFGPAHCTCGRPDCSVALDNDCGRWLEVWNLVFMQFDQDEAGRRQPLPAHGVDTGMGFERLVAILQGVYSNYGTDLFVPIMDAVQELRGHSAAEREAWTTAYRVVADHSRAIAFLIADGVLPGNEGRNYVLRLIMRRAMRFGRLMGFREPFLTAVVDQVVTTMGQPYPELVERRAWIAEVVAEEERRFERTLTGGLEILDGVIERARQEGATMISGTDVFRLYDTYGFPPDLTETIARESGLVIDHEGFAAAMAEQRQRARAGGAFATEAAAEAYRRLALPQTRFVGYETLEARGQVVALRSAGDWASEVGAGAAVEVVLDTTPFYAEAGGQVSDTGVLVGPAGQLQVTDSQSPVPGITVHVGQVTEGVLRVGDEVTAAVDADRRFDVMRNHTVTHLLHHALQEVLGSHAQQRGSYVAPDRVRFDFAHLRALTADELRAVESRVNDWIRQDAAVTWRYLPIEDARQLGAMMLFGEKYGDTVRVVEIEGISRELCGGTHLRRTGQIGFFLILNETSVGAGLRRIEALTGRGAERHVRQRLGLLADLAAQLGTSSMDALPARLEELMVRNRQLARDLEATQTALATARTQGAHGSVTHVDGVRLLVTRLEAHSPEALRSQVDVLRDGLGSGVVVAGAMINGAPRLVAAVSADLVSRGLHAGRLVQEAAALLGGRGGGRPHLAEGGGRNPAALDDALAAVQDIVRRQLDRSDGS